MPARTEETKSESQPGIFNPIFLIPYINKPTTLSLSLSLTQQLQFLIERFVFVTRRPDFDLFATLHLCRWILLSFPSNSYKIKYDFYLSNISIWVPKFIPFLDSARILYSSAVTVDFTFTCSDPSMLCLIHPLLILTTIYTHLSP